MRKFYTSYVYDGYFGERVFNNSVVFIDFTEVINEKQIPVLLQEKLSKEINNSKNGRFFTVTLINFWEID